MNIQDIQLDINKSPSVGKWVTIGQGDKGGTTIRATVYDNGAAAALAGMSARFEMRMPNATYFEDTNCTVSGNVITYVVDESHAALYAGGGSEAYFALHDGDTAIYSTERFHVRVARAASDGANPGRAWTNGIEKWLEDASDELDGYVASADARVGATINAANAAVEGMRSDVDDAIEDTEDVIGRAESAIDAMGDISELAVPLMSKDIRGGAKLEENGGLVLRDEKLGIGSLVQESDGTVRGGLAEVTAKGHAEQDGTPTPDSPVEIQVVKGRNLLQNTASSTTINGVTFTVNEDGSVTANGTASASTIFQIAGSRTIQSGTYTISGCPSGGGGAIYELQCTYNDTTYRDYGSGKQFTIASTVQARAAIAIRTGVTCNNVIFKPQIERGSVAHGYVPYGDYVGLDVYDGNTHVSTTPIPLPSRGWVGSLPDGTADVLTLDGAGKVEWTLADAETTTAATDGITGTVGTDVLSTTGQIADGATVLYKLATPVTEDCGYIEDWPTDIPEDAVISIPELDAVNIEYFIDSTVTVLAKQWYERAYAEIGQAVVDLAQRVAALES